MSSQFQVSRPTTAAEFEEYFALRWEVLRAFHELPKGSERDELDQSNGTADHVTVRNGQGCLIGVGRLHLNSATEAQIRFMAVRPESRAAGVGRALVTRLEEIAQEHKVERITLNAREGVVGFYERLGYRAIGDGPTMYEDIRHVQMEKVLLSTK